MVNMGGVRWTGNAKPNAMTVQGDDSRLLTLALLSPTSHQVNLLSINTSTTSVVSRHHFFFFHFVFGRTRVLKLLIASTPRSRLCG